MKLGKLQIPIPKKSAQRLLLIELPIILLWAIALWIQFFTNYQIDPVGASYRSPEQLEYITSSLFIAFASAVAADLCEREREPD